VKLWSWGALLLVIALALPATGNPHLARLLAQAVPTVAPQAVTTPAPTSILPLPTATPTTGTAVAPSATVAISHWLTYTVQPEDTLLSVALELGVNLEDMPCIIAPDFSPTQPLVIGNVLELPPPGTICHAVQPGESLLGVAAIYAVDPATVINVPWNRLARVDARVPLPVGWHLRVPLAATTVKDGSIGLASGQDFLGFMLEQPVNSSPLMAYAVGGTQRAAPPRAAPAVDQLPANWPYGSGHFVWPLYGWLTQSYRYDHRAIDVAAPLGTLVTAADRGVVIRAGWNNQGYGQFVIIDHNIDYITLYAHLSEILVEEGQVVAQGQTLGRVGSTGNSTGPHLHFEIRDFGRLTNPLELLGK
jgi:murein DD-endopeptidase MepM/ murein hydrolase activator NlpD